MTNKYYTPELEDLYVGYEHEVLKHGCFKDENFLTGYNCEDRWIKEVLLSVPHMIGYGALDFSKIRTKYLDKEDIESEGWRDQGRSLYYIGDYILSRFSIVGENDTEIRRRITIYTGNYIFYSGECKSVNELRKIMKWLKIK